MALPRAAALVVAVAMALTGALVGWPAQAQVTLSFHGHAGGTLRDGMVYFPHAYVRLQGRLSTGERVDEAHGFTAANPGPWLLAFRGRGLLAEPDVRYVAESRDYGAVILDDAGYAAVQARLAHWRSPAGSVYDLRRRNCITFVAEMARTAGLETPSEQTLSPHTFLDGLAQLNPLLAPAGPETADAPDHGGLSPPPGAA